MKNWMKMLVDHNNEIEVINETQVIIKNAFYDTINKIFGNLTLTRNATDYSDNKGIHYESIKEYLGY